MATHKQISKLGKRNLRYYSFISYPGGDRNLDRFAQRFRDALESKLKEHFPKLKNRHEYVFLDQDSIDAGEEWARKLGQALCQSAIMVALCVPMYSHSDHRWCGREWAGIEQLALQRFPSGPNPIFVVKLAGKELDKRIERLQVWDLSRDRTRGLQRLHEKRAFHECIDSIVLHLEKVLDVLVASEVLVFDCRDYLLPEKSAFRQTNVQRLIY